MTRLIVHTHVAALFLFICLRVQKQERKHLPIHIFDSTLATRLGKRTDVSSEAVNGGSARRGNTAGQQGGKPRGSVRGGEGPVGSYRHSGYFTNYTTLSITAHRTSTTTPPPFPRRTTPDIQSEAKGNGNTFSIIRLFLVREIEKKNIGKKKVNTRSPLSTR